MHWLCADVVDRVQAKICFNYECILVNLNKNFGAMIGTATILTREQPVAVGGWAPNTGKGAATKLRVGVVAATHPTRRLLLPSPPSDSIERTGSAQPRFAQPK